jgi:hypothetical protein
MIYNRSLTPEQVAAIYLSKTDLAVSQETTIGDVWRACVTPNDGFEDGAANCSNSLTIRNALPVTTNVILNSTYGTNYTNENLTVYYNTTDLDGHSFTNITNWYMNNTPIALLNMPFEAQASGNMSGWTRDYSNRTYHGTVSGAVWNSTGGYDRRGAYKFDGVNDNITTSDIATPTDFSIEMWVKADSVPTGSASIDANQKNLVQKDKDGSTGREYGMSITSIGTGVPKFGLVIFSGDASVTSITGTTTVAAGTWYHVVGTYKYITSGSSRLNIYVNGASDVAQVTNAVGPIQNSVAKLLIGAREYAGWPGYFNGTIDSVRVYNRTLTADQIKLLYQNRTDVIHFNETAVGDVWKACITPNDGVEDGVENCSNTLTVTEIPNSPPNVNLIELNSTYGTNYTNENLTLHWNVSDPDYDAVNSSIIWFRNNRSWPGTANATNYTDIRLLMPFENYTQSSDTYRDYSLYRNNGAVTGAVWNSTGGRDGYGAYVFDGGDSINVNADLSSATITIAMWIRPAVINSLDALVRDNEGADGLYITGNKFQLYSDGFFQAANSNLAVNTWQHVALTYSSGQYGLYINGTLDRSGSHGSTFTLNGFGIGNDAWIQDYEGRMDDIIIINRALSAEQIAMLYQNRTSMIHNGETDAGDIWRACVTPTDGKLTGATNCSNNLTVRATNPRITNMVLNSTYGTNYTSENLTVYYTSANDRGTQNKNITNWHVNGMPVSLLNMPFEINNYGNMSFWTKDYSNRSNHGTVSGATWNATGGYDGKAAYAMDGNDDYINMPYNFGRPSYMTVTLWFRTTTAVDDILFGQASAQPPAVPISFIPTITIQDDGKIRAEFFTGAAGNITTSSAYNDGAWHHAAFVARGTSQELFIDGVSAGTRSGTIDQSWWSNSTIGTGYGDTSRGFPSNAWAYFNGTIDDFSIYNRSLSADQILLLYQNRTDAIHFNETSIGDVWMACVTPNDGIEEGTANCSNSLVIVEFPNEAPIVNNVALNSTYGTNYTNENLTVWYNSTDADGNNVTNITNWYLNGTSIAVLNMPFEAHSYNSSSENVWTKDYSNFSNNGTVGGAVWNATGGYNGRGAYTFDGSSSIMVPHSTALNMNYKQTVTAWVYSSNYAQTYARIAEKFKSGSSTWVCGIHQNKVYYGMWKGGSQTYFDNAGTLVNGQWHFIACRWDGTTMRVFVDGQMTASSASLAAPSDTSTDPLYIGEYGGVSNGFTGTIDEVRLYNRSLTADQILLLYQNRTDVIHFNETNIGDVWKACVTPNDGVEYGLTNCSNTLTVRNAVPVVSNIVLNSTYNTNYTHENLTVYYNTADADGDAVKNITNWYLNGTSIAMLNMPFEANNASNMSIWTKDYSNRSNHGRIYNAAWNATGGYDAKGAYKFDGDADYINVSSTGILRGGTTATIALWVKVNGSHGDGQGATFFESTNSEGYTRFSIFLQSNGTVRVGGRDTDTGSMLYTESTTTVKNNTWTHLAGVWDSVNDRMLIYINGTLDKSQSISIGSFTTGAAASVTTGGVLVSGVVYNDFNGFIDELRVYNRSLSADQILLLYQNRTDVIHFNETTNGENWSACVTPNDGIEDGLDVCSVNLTIRSSGVAALQVDPLNAWVLNDTIKFECNASSAVSLANGSLWTNYSGTWSRNASKSLSGTTSDYEFNVSGFTTQKTFVWNCEACDSDQCDFGDTNRTITIDLTRPGIQFVSPTPANNARNSTSMNWAYVNVSTSDSSNLSAFIDFNRTLLGWWRFDNSTADSSTYGNSGTITDDPELWTGTRGKAYYLDGEDYITIAGESTYDFAGGDSMTLEAWIRPTGIGLLYPGADAEVIFGKGIDGGTRHILFSVNANNNGQGNLTFLYKNAAQAVHAYSASTLVYDNSWYHVAFTYTYGTGSSAKMYINGQQVSGAWNTGDGNSAPDLNDYPLIIGAETSAGANERYKGVIDEPRVWKRALGAAEINASYQNQLAALYRNFTSLPSGRYNYTAYAVDMAGNLNQTEYLNFSVNYVPVVSNMMLNSTYNTNYTNENLTVWYSTSDTDGDSVKNITNWYLNGTSIMVLNMPFESNAGMNMSNWTKDYSNNSNHGTTVTATWRSNGGFDNRGAYNFSGTGRILIPEQENQRLTSQGTLTAWIYLDAFSDHQGIVVKAAGGGAGGQSYGMSMGYTDLKQLIRFGIGNGSSYYSVFSVGNLSLKSWYHVVGTWNGATLTVYINGAYNNSASVAAWATPNATHPLRIGASFGDGYYFNGIIDGVQIYNRSLTADQVKLLYMNRTDKIHFNETSVGDVWKACVTPNDGYEDGLENCSNNLTIRSSGVTSLQIDPLNAWVVNDTIKFECNASSAVSLVNGSLWHNYSGTWSRNGTVSIGSTYAEFEFNRSGFNAEKTFVWACQACDSDQCAFSTPNRTITIDLTKPVIQFVAPTPANNVRNSTLYNWAYVNVSTSDTANSSAFIDWNRSLAGWWRFENSSKDSSSYGVDGTPIGSPEVWTGPRGKAYRFGGNSDAINLSSTIDFAASDFSAGFTISLWAKPGQAIISRQVLFSSAANTGGTAWQVYMWWNTNNHFGAAQRYSGTQNDFEGSVHNPGRWYHVVLVWNGTTSILYVDGTPENQVAGGQPDQQPASRDVIIGYFKEYPNTWFNGPIDEVEVWKRALSPQEVNASYQNHIASLYRNFTGLASGRYNYTAYAVDMAGNLNTTGYRNFSVNYVPVVSGMVLNSTYNTNYTNENLTVWYNTTDADGDVLTNITSWYLNNSPMADLSLPFDTNVWSTATDAVKDYSGRGNNATLKTGLKETADTGTNSTNVFETGNWLLSSSNDAYNGWIFEATSGAAAGQTSVISDYIVHAAQNNKSIVLAIPLTGLSSGDGYHIYYNDKSVPRWTASGRIGGAYVFDGIDDYIYLDSHTPSAMMGATKVTIDAWIKPNKVTGTQFIFNQNGPFGLWLNGDTLVGRIYNGSWVQATGSIHMPVNTWHHVAITYDGSYLRLYVNSTLDNETPMTGSFNYNGGGGIGYSNNGNEIGQTSSYFNGTIDEFHIYNRTLTQDQLAMAYSGITNRIHFNETAVGEVWKACVTPNDAYDDGNAVCSADLTIRASGVSALQVDPLNAWVVNDTVKFECNATSAVSLVNGSLWHNYSGTWTRASYKSISGTTAEYEFNLSGFSTEKTFNWACEACISDECALSNNRTLTIDLTRPSIQYATPTPANNARNSTMYNWVLVNVSTTDSSNRSAFIDFNRSLIGWWRFENNTNDSSTYSNSGACTAGSTCPELWTGPRGKAYRFDGVDDSISLSGLDTSPDNTFTWEAWIKITSSTNAFRRWLTTTTGGFGANTLCLREDSGGDIQLYAGGASGGAILTREVWHHFAIVSNGTNTSLYDNGVLKIALANSIDPETGFFIGGYYSGGEYAKGEFDEIRIWDRALSVQEINASYQNQITALYRNFTGLSSGRYNYTAYAVDMAGNLNQTEYRNYSVNYVPVVSNVVLNSTYGTNYTNENLTVWYATSDSDSDAVNNITNWYLNGTSVMVLNMPFETTGGSNESTWSRDYTNNSLNSAFINATWNSTGDMNGGGAYYFDGTRWIQVTTSTKFNFANGKFSLESWVRRSTTSGGHHMIFSRASANYYQSIIGNYLFLSIINVTGNQRTCSASITSLQAGPWYHLVTTYDNDTVRHYVNGTFDGSCPGMGGINSGFGTDFYIGRWQGSGDYEFRGTIGTARVWNRTLTADEIKLLYQQKDNVIHFNETNDDDVWNACITPNDGIEDGTTVCSNDLTVRSGSSLIDCGVLDQADTVYKLTRNVSSPGTCFAVTARNVTIDCGGYSINYSSTTLGYGVYSNQNFTTVMNCAINLTGQTQNNSHAVYYLGTWNGTIHNNSLQTWPLLVAYSWYNYGIAAGGTNTNINITGNTITTQAGHSYGIYLSGNGGSAIINSNRITTTGPASHGIYADNADNLNISYNNVTTTQYVADGIRIYQSNNNNISRNNVDVQSGNEFGEFGIFLYNSAYNNLTNNNVTTPYMPCYVVVGGGTSSNYNHTIGTDNLADGQPVYYTANAQNTVYENLDWTGYGEVAFGKANNITVRNVKIDGDGLNLFYVQNSLFQDNNISGENSYASFFTDYTYYNNFTRNNISTGANYFMLQNAHSNSFTNNYVGYSTWLYGSGSSNYSGDRLGNIRMQSSANNVFNNVTVSGSVGLTIYDTINSVFNNSRISGTTAIWFEASGAGRNINLYDTVINGTSQDIYMVSGNSDSYINTTNATLAGGGVVFPNGAVQPKLNTHWWLDAYVNDTGGQPINLATVTAYDTYNAQAFSKETNASGRIQRQAVLEKWRNGSQTYYYSNYTVNATKTGYLPANTTTNMSTNRWVNLTLVGATSVTQVDPLDAWVVNDTIKFECNASAGATLVNGSVWHNYTGAWTRGAYKSISGAYSEYEFNLSGFSTEKTFLWGCEACIAGYCAFSQNRTLTIDLTRPGVQFASPTPANNVRNSTTYNWALVNVTTTDTANRSAFIDWNRDLAGWWRFENNSKDSSSYGNDGSFSSMPELWTGARGKAFWYKANADPYMAIANQPQLNLTDNITISLWLYPAEFGSYYAIQPVYKSTSTSDANYVLYYFGDYGGEYPWQLGDIAFLANRGGGWGGVSGTYKIPQLNRWYHVAWTYNSVQGGQLYVDGSTVGARTGSGILATTTAEVRVTHQKGAVDELMIFKRELSASEISAIYANQVSAAYSNFTGLASGMYNYTAYAVDMAGNLNTTGYRNYSVNYVPVVSNVVLNSTYNTNYTNENLTVWYTTSDTDSDSVKNITNWYVNGTSIMVLNMPFEANAAQNMSSWTKDYSEHNNHGSVSGAIWNSTGGYGGKGAYKFDGIDDYVTLGDKNSLDAGTGDFAILAWVKADYLIQYTSIVMKGSVDSDCGSPSNAGYSVIFYAGKIMFKLNTGGGSGCYSIYGSSVDTNWHHVAVVADRDANASVYIDGVLVNTTDVSAYSASLSNSNPFRIGIYSTAVANMFNGSIDEIRMYNRTLSASQIQLIYQNQTDRIHHDTTRAGENWSACVTPNDGIENGITVCSANLTIRSSAITSLQVDPLNAWVVNDSVKFECNATSAVSLVNGSLWHNYTGTWTRASYKSISGTTAEYEFNISGFNTEKTFVWACEACDSDQCAFSTPNRTLTIDLSRPSIQFVAPTPANNARNSTMYNWALVNVTTTDTANSSAFIDFNRSLVGWWRFENNTLDSSSYGNNLTCSGVSCPELWTGTRGKAYRFDGTNDKPDAGNPADGSLDIGYDDVTVEAWLRTNSSSSMRITSKRGGAADVPGYSLLIYNSQVLFEILRVGAWVIVYGANVTDNNWHHVAAVVDRQGYGVIYTDGVPGTPVDFTSLSTYDISNAYTLSVGSFNPSVGAVFNGTLDEVRIYRRALSPQEVNASYQNQLSALYRNFTSLPSGRYNYTAYAVDMAGNLNQTEYRNFSVNYVPVVSNVVLNSTYGTNYTNENLTVWYSTSDTDGDARKNITNWYLNGTSIAVLNMPFESNAAGNMSSWTKDYSVYGRHGTVDATRWNATGGYDGRGAYTFNGSSGNIYAGADPINDTDFTYSYWIYINYQSNWNYQFSHGANTFVFLCHGSNQYMIRYKNSTSALIDTYLGGTCPTGQWTHYVLSYNRANHTLYIYENGNQKFAFNIPDVIYVANAALYIGGTNGTIDEFAIWNRSISADQAKLLFQNQTDKIHFNETTNGENWSACVTPNDGIEDGSAVCSANLTIRSSAITSLQVDPLNAWVVNDSVKFECNATSAVSLVNGSLWHNYSGTWTRASYKSISGTTAEYEFNISGFSTEKTFVWACQACDSDQCAFSTPNMTLTIDLSRPSIQFVAPTPANNNRNSTTYNWALVNVTTTDTANRSAFIDWNRSLVGWWRFENNTLDSSTYGNNCTQSNVSRMPELWTGPRGKAYRFDNQDNLYAVSNNYPAGDLTVTAWFSLHNLSASTNSVVFDRGWGANSLIVSNSAGAGDLVWRVYNGSIQYIIAYDVINANTWYFAAGTVDTTNKRYTIYINGVQVATGTYTGNLDHSGTTTIGAMAQGLSAGSTFQGVIDEVMLWDRLLSGQEINASYQNQDKELYRNFTSLPSGRYNYTAYAVDMAGNLNTTGYRNYSVNYVPVVSNVVLNSTYNTNYTNENLTVWYTTSDTDSDSVKNITNWYLNGTSIAVLNMPFESNGMLNMSNWTKDYSPRTYYGTITNATWNSTAGYEGRGAYQFDGKTSYMTLPVAALPFPMSKFTIEGWIYPRPSGGVVVWNNEFQAWVTSNLLRARIFTGGTTAYYIEATIISYDNWYHFAWTYDGETQYLYINGQLNGTDATPSGAATGYGGSNSISYIGRDENTPGFNGTIDDFRVWNRSLTADQILLLYQNKTDLIVSQETTAGDTWHACITPNDGIEDGTTQCSVNLEVEDYTPCMVINAAGKYQLTENAYGAPKFFSQVPGVDKACILINANNVEFSCNGHSITNSGVGAATNAAGIIVKHTDPGDNRNVTIKDCRVTGYKRGIQVRKSADNVIMNSTVSGSTEYGVFFDGSLRGRITESTVYNSTLAGIALNNTKATNITNVLAYNNTGIGISIGAESNNTQLRDITVYANGNDFLANNTDGNKGIDINITNMSLRSPSGITTNSTEINAADTVDEYNTYNFNWTRQKVALPVGTSSFRGKFIEITQPFGTGNIKKVEFTWTQAEVSGFDEDYLHLYKYSEQVGVWQKLNDTPNAVTNTLSLTDLFPQSTYGILHHINDSEPGMTGVVLNATDFPLNRTDANLTAWPTGVNDPEGHDVKLYYNWYINSSSITVLNLLMGQNRVYSPDKQTVYDVSRYANNARLGNATAEDSSEPVFDKNAGYDGFGAYLFDGIDDYMSIPNSGSLNQGGNLTLEAWVKTDNATGKHVILTKGKYAVSWQYGMGTNGQELFARFDTGDVQSGGTPVKTGVWQHFVVIYNTTHILFYVNGTSISNITAAQPRTAGGNLDIGYSDSTTTPTEYWQGAISDIKIYNRTLTPQQIAIQYNNGAGRYNLTDASMTIKNQQWNVSATPVDSRGKNGTTVWSSQLIIRNTPPGLPSHLSPNDGNNTLQTRTPTFNWTSATDIDGDALSYRVNISGGCGASIIYTGINHTNRTASDELHTYDECSDWYNWTVTAYDGDDYGLNTSPWRFKIMPVVSLNLDRAILDFGTMLLGQQANTTLDSPLPYTLQNDGTVVADVINATADSNLWIRSPSPTDKFQLKVNYSELDSIDLTQSAVNWTNVSTNTITIIKSLNYSEIRDTARLDFRIEVPSDEPAGLKQVLLTFYGTQTG